MLRGEEDGTKFLIVQTIQVLHSPHQKNGTRPESCRSYPNLVVIDLGGCTIPIPNPTQRLVEESRSWRLQRVVITARCYADRGIAMASNCLPVRPFVRLSICDV